MNPTKMWIKPLLAILSFLLGFSVNFPNVNSQDNPNSITFDNQAGELGLVKFIGPSRQTIEVSKGQSQTVNVAPGEYYIFVRYGINPEEYKYAKGDPL